MNRIAIIGPGAIGSLYAALLARGGRDVFLLDHREERAARLTSEGITVHDGDEAWHIPVTSSTRAADFGVADAVCVCTKAYQTASAVSGIAPLVDPDTILVSLQNGLGNIEILAGMDPSHCVCGSTGMGALLDETGTLRWTGHGTTQLAPFEKTPVAHAETIRRLLVEAGCECEVLPDAESMLWGKLVINAAINPITALYGITNGDLLKHDEARERAFAAAREARMIADTKGITLPYDDVVAAVTDICQRTSSNRSSTRSCFRGTSSGRTTTISSSIYRSARWAAPTAPRPAAAVG